MALTTRLPSPNIEPFYGFVETTGDALRLIQAARQGIIPRITRRLNDIERRAMVKSGAVFIFSNEESGIKRWTEGLSWSASRIVGNFLVYREVSERGVSRHGSSGAERPGARRRLNLVQLSSSEQAQRKIEKSLVGCLADDHDRFKNNGLIKKTITVKVEGSDHHLIAYYNQDDVRLGKLRPPTSRADIMSLEIPPELLETTKFRIPPRTERGPDGRPRYVCDMDETDAIIPRLQPSYPLLRDSVRSLAHSTITSFDPLPFFSGNSLPRSNEPIGHDTHPLLPAAEIIPSTSKATFPSALDLDCDRILPGDSDRLSVAREEYGYRNRSLSDSGIGHHHRYTPYPHSLSTPISPRTTDTPTSAGESQTFFWPSPQTTIMSSHLSASDDMSYPTPPPTAQSNTLTTTNSSDLAAEPLSNPQYITTFGKDSYDPWAGFPFQFSTKLNESLDRSTFPNTIQSDGQLQSSWLWK